MSKQTCNTDGGIDGHCACAVPCFNNEATVRALPDRSDVADAWVGFNAHYPAYLNLDNWKAWFMQDKIVYAFMNGDLMTREEWKAEIE